MRAAIVGLAVVLHASALLGGAPPPRRRRAQQVAPLRSQREPPADPRSGGDDEQGREVPREGGTFETDGEDDELFDWLSVNDDDDDDDDDDGFELSTEDEVELLLRAEEENQQRTQLSAGEDEDESHAVEPGRADTTAAAAAAAAAVDDDTAAAPAFEAVWLVEPSACGVCATLGESLARGDVVVCAPGVASETEVAALLAAGVAAVDAADASWRGRSERRPRSGNEVDGPLGDLLGRKMGDRFAVRYPPMPFSLPLSSLSLLRRPPAPTRVRCYRVSPAAGSVGVTAGSRAAACDAVAFHPPRPDRVAARHTHRATSRPRFRATTTTRALVRWRTRPRSRVATSRCSSTRSCGGRSAASTLARRRSTRRSPPMTVTMSG